MSTNENLAAVVVDSNTPLKQMLLEYVGNKYATPSDEGEFEVTVQMIVDTLAHEFPECITTRSKTSRSPKRWCRDDYCWTV